jgi:putative hemolysin
MQLEVKTGLGTVILLVFAITAVYIVQTVEKNQADIDQQVINNQIVSQKKSTQMANPASVFCEQNAGKSEIRTAADGGQTGYCKFSDGSECEEWQYYRGECKQGDNKTATTDISNWQTYRNDRYGFEFQYPKNWKINISQDPISKNSFEANSILIPAGHHIGFGIVENKDNLDIITFWKNEYSWTGEQGASFRNLRKENLFGSEAARFTPVSDIDGKVGNVGFWIKLEDNNFFSLDSFDLTKDEEINLNKVISTFKFIN